MYQLINNITDYPQFLHWCANTTILEKNTEQIIASIDVKQGILAKTFTTVNDLKANKRIDIALIDGPFKHLIGHWQFDKLDNMTKISFEIEFEFNSKLLDITASPIFTNIAAKQLNCFVQRAQEIYI